MIFEEGPIIACSSSSTDNAAIAVIRLSGFEKLNTFQKIFSIDLNSVLPRRIYNSKLIDLDSILFSYFEAPNSYNGENILELYVHGNILNIENIIKYFISNFNIRLAKNGEFTYRALKNKKLSVMEVEGLDLLLSANSDFILKQGQELLNGKLKDSYLKLRDAFLNLKASVELAIDFLEDIGEEAQKKFFNESILKFRSIIDYLHSRTSVDSKSILNPDIVLIGKPNSGKSSLFNALLKFNRSIVSHIAGTTRDYVTEKINFNGVNFNLIDTAGIRKTDDIIEQEGVDKTYEILKNSFFKILLINPFHDQTDLSFSDFDLVIFTHDDLKVIKDSSHIKKDIISISLIDKNLDLKFIEEKVLEKYKKMISNSPIAVQRHIALIRQIKLEFEKFSILTTHETDIAVISHELALLGNFIDELLGIIGPDEVLDSIFDNFCIGK